MQPLKDFKMLDLSRLLPGPYCSLLLADMGMEVLKVEDIERGDYARFNDPLRKGINPSFLALNRNKKSMKLNLKTDEGKEIFYRLIKVYDIVLEGFRPGVMERLGVGYEELRKRNPRLIFCSLSGYGQDGPYRDRSGHDINYLSIGGILGLMGSKDGPPVIPCVQIADIGGGGLMAAIAILTAIIHRERTGEGQFLDISMLDGILSWLSPHVGRYFIDGELPERGEMRLSGRYACYQVYETKDKRYMSLGALEEKFWKNFCEAIGREELIEKQYVEGEERLRIIEEIKRVFRERAQAEWVDFFKGKDVCCEPVLNFNETFKHPHVIHRNIVKDVEYPEVGRIRQIGSPIKSSAFSLEIRRPPPSWGEHTIEVLKEIGYSADEIKRFKDANII